VIDRRLGKGLESLIARTVPAPDQRVHDIPVGEIVPNPRQPRQVINEAALEGLAQSIRAHGVLQPVVVRRAGSGFELVAGERRLRASRLAGKATIPALIIEAAELQSLELALIENIQRENLSALEEAEAFREILASSDMTQQQLADRLGRSRASVANTLRLLELPDEVKQLLRSGALSAGQAKVLLSGKSTSDISALAVEAARHNWSVRELERRIRSHHRGRSAPHRNGGRTRLPNVASYEEQLRIIYGTKVRIEGGTESGRIAFEYYSLADLNRLVGLLLAGGLVLDEKTRRGRPVQVPELPDDAA
jgi:ParB family chromosome partitioning protein